MDIEVGEITCKGQETSFQVLSGNLEYVFTFANSIVYEYLGETEKLVDCSQYVLECQELFEEIAKDMITKSPIQHDHRIDSETIARYFNC